LLRFVKVAISNSRWSTKSIFSLPELRQFPTAMIRQFELLVSAHSEEEEEANQVDKDLDRSEEAREITKTTTTTARTTPNKLVRSSAWETGTLIWVDKLSDE